MRGDMTRAQAALVRMVRALVAADAVLGRFVDCPEKPALTVEGWDVQPWASLTFNGHRHVLRVQLDGPMHAVEAALDRMEALTEAQAPVIGGQVLIDLVVGEIDAEIGMDGTMRALVELEALTVAE
jgi:hypothetical protein